MAKLITPLQVGRRKLLHRVVVAPMTRYRADDKNVQLAYVKEYYSQRTCVPGTLVVTEATYISPRSIGAHSTPGVWSEAQISAWKEVTRAVHGHGSFIFCQLWALGQAADAELLKKKGENLGPAAPSRSMISRQYQNRLPRRRSNCSSTTSCKRQSTR